MKLILDNFKSILKYRWLVVHMVSASLKVRYKRSILGFFWSLLGPILNYGVLSFVFYYGMKIQVDNYYMYFFPAVIYFSFLSMTISQASGSFLVNEMYLKKIFMPKIIFPFNTAAAEVVTFVFNLLSIIFLGIVLGKLHLSWNIFYLPVSLLCGFIFAYGAGLILSTLVVFFRDMGHIIPILLQISLYLTPILYDVRIFPAQYHWIILLNPFYHFVQNYRFAFGIAEFSLTNFVTCWVLALGTLYIGMWVVKRNENKIVFKL